MKYIKSDKLPSPAGHYSQGVLSGRMLFVSGQLPACEVSADFETQVHSTMQKCTHILEAAGLTLADVVQCTAYIVEIDNWPRFNGVYAGIMGEHRPARTVVPVPELHY